MSNLLLDYFDQLVCRAEDVPRLNEAILQLAVQGKLVAQDPNDEPASELLRRIQIEKQNLGSPNEGIPPVTNEEIPYTLPANWSWVRLGHLVEFQNGYAFKSL